MTSEEMRQAHKQRGSIETAFKRSQPTMPKGREATVNRDKHFGAAYGKSCTPINHPRPKDQPNKIAVAAEGTRSWGSGLGNNVSDTMRGVNGQRDRMDEKLDRKLGRWRKERKNRAKPVCVVVGPGVEQRKPIKVTERRFVEIPKPEEQPRSAWNPLGSVDTYRKRYAQRA